MPSALQRVAASSMASGMPSRQRQIAAAARAKCRSGTSPGSEARTLAMKRRSAPVFREVSSITSDVLEHLERRHAVDVFAIGHQRLAAGGEDGDAGARVQQVLDEMSGRADQVLAVVEHEQQRAAAYGGGERLARDRPGHRHHAERTRHRGADQLGVDERPQLGQPHAVGMARHHLARHLEGEARLADAAGADQRQQAVMRQQLADIGDDGLAPDQLGHPLGQVGRHANRRQLGDRSVAALHLGGELVAAPGDGADRSALVAQRPAQGGNVRVQAVVLDHATGPDPVHQLLVADDPAAALDERHQHVEGAPADLDRLAAVEQLAAMRNDGEAAETKRARRVVGCGRHRPIL